MSMLRLRPSALFDVFVTDLDHLWIVNPTRSHIRELQYNISNTKTIFLTARSPIVESDSGDYFLLDPASCSSTTTPIPVSRLYSLEITSFVSVSSSLIALGNGNLYTICCFTLRVNQIVLPFKVQQFDACKGDRYEVLIAALSTEGFLSFRTLGGNHSPGELPNVEKVALGRKFSLVITTNGKLNVINMKASQLTPISIINNVSFISVHEELGICCAGKDVYLLNLDATEVTIHRITNFSTTISDVIASESGIYVVDSRSVYYTEYSKFNSLVFKKLFILDDSNTLTSDVTPEWKFLDEDWVYLLKQDLINELEKESTFSCRGGEGALFWESFCSESTDCSFDETQISNFESDLGNVTDVDISKAIPLDSVIDCKCLGNSELPAFDQKHNAKRFYFESKFLPGHYSLLALDNLVYMFRGQKKYKVSFNCEEIEKVFVTNFAHIIKTNAGSYLCSSTMSDEDPRPLYGLDNIDVIHFACGSALFALSSKKEVFYHVDNSETAKISFTLSENLVNVSQISVSCDLAAFVTFDGFVWIWNTKDDQPFRHEYLRNVGQISVSSSQCLVVLNDGTLLGWSSEEDCGFMPSGVGKIPMETPLIIDVPPIEYVAVSRDHAICLTKEGTVYTFGSNNYGKCGVNSDDDVITPTLLPFEGVDHVAIGEDNSYFIKDDLIYACGNQDGLLRKTYGHLSRFKASRYFTDGKSFRGGSASIKKSPTSKSSIQFLEEAQFGLGRIVFANSDNILVVDNDGQVYGKGNNLFEVLGTLESSMVEFTRVENVRDVSDVFVADQCSFFKTRNGDVFACGDGEKLAMANVMDSDDDFFDEIPAPIMYSELNNAQYICGDDEMIWVLFEDGRVGFIQEEEGFSYLNLSNIVQIAFNGNCGWFLKEDGSVYTVCPNITRVVGLSNVVMLSISDSHGLALLNDGNVVAWGYTDFMGLDSEVEEIDLNLEGLSSSSCFTSEGENCFGNVCSFKIIPHLPKVKAIAAGDGFSMFVTEEGKVLVIGDNSKGQIGLGEVKEAQILTEIPNIENVTGVKALDVSSVIVSNGELYITGEIEKHFSNRHHSVFIKAIIPASSANSSANSYYSELGFVESTNIDYSNDALRVKYLNNIRMSTDGYNHLVINQKEIVISDDLIIQRIYLDIENISHLYATERFPLVCTIDLVYYACVFDFDEDPVEIEYRQIESLNSIEIQFFTTNDNCTFGLGANGIVYVANSDFNFRPLTMVTNVRQMYASNSSISFVTFDGSLWTWYMENSRLFRHPHLSNVRQVAIGECDCFHLVVLNDGSLLGWGSNENFGLEHSSSDEIPMETPVIIDVPPIEYVAVSGDHAICLTKEGTVYTFGSNNYGKCGVNSDDDVITPTLLPFEGVDHVAIGEDSSYFIKDDLIHACGKHCGLFSRTKPLHQFKPTVCLSTGTKPRPKPIALTNWSNEKNTSIRQNAFNHTNRIASFGSRVLYVTDEMDVIGKGENFWYQLGQGHNDCVSKFVAIPFVAPSKAVFTYQKATFIISSDGAAYSCGTDLSYMISNKETESGKTFKRPGMLCDFHDCGYFHQDSDKLFALKQENVIVYSVSETPRIISSNVVQIVSSSTETFWLLKSDGTVYRYSKSLNRIIGLSRVVLLSISNTHGLALLDNGNVVSWGEATHNALGYDSDSVPDDIDLDDGAIDQIDSFDLGQCSPGFEPFRSCSFKIIPNLPKVKAIAAGDGYSMFVTEEGKVLVIGDNSKGQIGLGEVKEAQILTEIPNIENVTGVKALQNGSVLVSNEKLYITGEISKYFFGEYRNTFTKISGLDYTPALDYSKLGFVQPEDIDYSEDDHLVNYLNRFRVSERDRYHFIDNFGNSYDYFYNLVKLPLSHDVVQSFATENLPIFKNPDGQYFEVSCRDSEPIKRTHIRGLDSVDIKYFCYSNGLFALSADGHVYQTNAKGKAKHITELSNIRQMSIGEDWAGFVTFDGFLYEWNRCSGKKFMQHPYLRNVRQVAFRSDDDYNWHCLVVLNDGTLLGWGENKNCGFMPSGDKEISRDMPIKIDVPPIEYAAVAQDLSICLTKEGGVYTFGYSKCTMSTNVVHPNLLPFRNVQFVACSRHHSFFIMNDFIHVLKEDESLLPKSTDSQLYASFHLPTASTIAEYNSLTLSKGWNILENSALLKAALEGLNRLAHSSDSVVYLHNTRSSIVKGPNSNFELGNPDANPDCFVEVLNHCGATDVFLLGDCTFFVGTFQRLYISGNCKHLEVSSSIAGDFIDIAPIPVYFDQFRVGVRSVCGDSERFFFLLHNGNVEVISKHESSSSMNLSNVVQMTQNTNFVWFLKEDGSVYTVCPNISRVVGLSNVVMLSISDSHGLALLNDGNVVAWGYTNFMGLDSEVEEIDLNLEGLSSSSCFTSEGENCFGNVCYFKMIPNLPKVKAIAAGDGFSLFVTEQGKVMVIGDNSQGQIGLGEVKEAQIITEIPNIENVTGVKALQNGSVLVSNEKLYITGEISKYFFGEYRNTFTKIMNVIIYPLLDQFCYKELDLDTIELVKSEFKYSSRDKWRLVDDGMVQVQDCDIEIECGDNPLNFGLSLLGSLLGFSNCGTTNEIVNPIENVTELSNDPQLVVEELPLNNSQESDQEIVTVKDSSIEKNQTAPQIQKQEAVKKDPTIVYSSLGFVNPQLIDYEADRSWIKWINKFRSCVSLYDLNITMVINEQEFIFKSHGSGGKVTIDFPNVTQIYATELYPIIGTSGLTYHACKFKDYGPRCLKYHHITELDGEEINYFVFGGELYFFALCANGNVFIIDDDFEAERLSKIQNVRQISAFKSSVAFVTFDGFLWLWDTDRYGAFGGQLVCHPYLRNVKQICIGNFSDKKYSHLVVLNDGTLLGWGSRTNFGLEHSSLDEIPMETPVIIDVPPIEYVSLSKDHAICLTKEGTVYTFGCNGYSQCGVGRRNLISPTLLHIEAVEHVSAGDGASFCLKNGIVHTCGHIDHFFAQNKPLHQFKPTVCLSTGTKPRPKPIALTNWSNEKNTSIRQNALNHINRIANFGSRVLYVTSEGVVLGKGCNRHHELGQDHNERISEFTVINNANNTASSTVFTFDQTSYFQDVNGNVFGCGRDLDKIRFGNKKQYRSLERSPIELTELKNLVNIDHNKSKLWIHKHGKVFKGEYHELQDFFSDVVQMVIPREGREWFLKSDGTVFITILKLRRLCCLSRVVLLSASETHCLALRDDGKVVSWGNMNGFNLGYGPDDVPDDVDLDDGRPLEEENYGNEFEIGFNIHYAYFFKIIPNLPKVKAIAAGDGFSMFVTEEGKVMVIGDNSQGQIGLGEVKEAQILTEIPNIDNVTGVKALQNGSVLVSNEKLYITGEISKYFFGEYRNTFTIVTLGEQALIEENSLKEEMNADQEDSTEQVEKSPQVEELSTMEIEADQEDSTEQVEKSPQVEELSTMKIEADQEASTEQVEKSPQVEELSTMEIEADQEDSTEQVEKSPQEEELSTMEIEADQEDSTEQVEKSPQVEELSTMEIEADQEDSTEQVEKSPQVEELSTMEIEADQEDSTEQVEKSPQVEELSTMEIEADQEDSTEQVEKSPQVEELSTMKIEADQEASTEQVEKSPQVEELSTMEIEADQEDSTEQVEKSPQEEELSTMEIEADQEDSTEQVEKSPQVEELSTMEIEADQEDSTEQVEKSPQVEELSTMEIEADQEDSTEQVEKSPQVEELSTMEIEADQEDSTEQVEKSPQVEELSTMEIEADQEDSTEQVEKSPQVEELSTMEIEADQEDSTEQVEKSPQEEELSTMEIEADQEDSTEQVEKSPQVEELSTMEIEADQEDSTEQVEKSPQEEELSTMEIEADQEDSTEQVEKSPQEEELSTMEIEADQEDSTEQVEKSPQVEELSTMEIEADQEDSTEQVEKSPQEEELSTMEIEADQEDSTEQVEKSPQEEELSTMEIEADQEDSTEQVEKSPQEEELSTMEIEADQEDSTEQVEKSPQVEELSTMEIEADQEDSTEQVEKSPQVEELSTMKIEADQEASTEQVEKSPQVEELSTMEIEADQEDSTEQVEKSPQEEELSTMEIEADQEDSTEQVEKSPQVEELSTMEIEADQEDSTEQVEKSPQVEELSTMEIEADQEDSTEQVEKSPQVEELSTMEIEADQEDSTEQVEKSPQVEELSTMEIEADQEDSTEPVEKSPQVEELSTMEIEADQEDSTEQVEKSPQVEELSTMEIEADQEDSTEQVEKSPQVEELSTMEIEADQEDSTEQVVSSTNVDISQTSTLICVKNHSKPSSVYFEGYLTKRGGFFKTWKRRWFVLKHCTLNYYADPFDDTAKNSLIIKQESVVAEPSLAQYQSLKLSKALSRFLVFQSQPGQREFYLLATCKEERDRWIDKISAAIPQ
ncbi:hypothetical protein P9112_007097 [Eukaryota sp. TZLM1-RC]